SHFQLHPRQRGSTRYLSTAGQPSRAQLDVLDRVYASMNPGSTIVAAVDADAGGLVIARSLEHLTHYHSHLVFRRDLPPSAKDWNEALQRIEHDYIRSLTSGPQHACSGPER
ncbi:MAG: toprim domain-containing protein, partial [Polyangiaceae bacterium]